MATFISVSEFKTATSAVNVKILRNKTTGKLFAIAGDSAYKAQQDIDMSATIMFMYETDFSEGCFINVKESTVEEIGVL
jgi:hypothetical protein